MAEFNSFGKDLDEFKQLLISNKFIKDKELSDLMSNVNDEESQLTALLTHIKSRDKQEINLFIETIGDSYLTEDECDSSLMTLKYKLSESFKHFFCPPKLSSEELILINSQKVKSNKYGDVYPMTARPRGFCIMIDNQQFKTNNLSDRKGSEVDSQTLSLVFSQLGFDVKHYINKTTNQMQRILQSYSQNPELSKHDALVVIILSHGIKDEIFGICGSTVKVDTILEYYNNINCSLLRNKPKMFFLSACRGEEDKQPKIDTGISCLSGAPLMMLRMSHMPTWSDIFVYYSTINGYVSLRNTSSGSWFGHELAKCLVEFAHREHLHDLMTTKVAQRLHERFSVMNGKIVKQSIETQTKGFVKKLYFNPGLYETDGQ
ncbi:caspase-3-like [Oppia nitens]|uniref:caspase-3-like n=1 Tax=Oppia nitens TaxID=1686743 RepID=UPI0023DC21AC|nr:caspase-3-like [Oppia nitens]